MGCEQHHTTENGTAAPEEGAGDAPLPSSQHHGIIQDDQHHGESIPLDSDDDDEMPDDDYQDSEEEDDDEEMADNGHQPPPPPFMPELFEPYVVLLPLQPTGTVVDEDDDEMAADGHQPPPASTLEFAPYFVLRALLPSGTLAYVLVPMPLDGSTPLGLGDGGGYSNGGFGAVPAPDDAVDGLKKREFRGGSQQDAAAGGCRICFEDFEDGEEVSVMPCSGAHEFHTQCIAKWLGVSNACPLCRHQLPTTAPVV